MREKKFHSLRVLFCLSLLGWGEACSGIWSRTEIRASFSLGERILVLPFENFSNYPGGGEFVAELVALELRKDPGITVLTRKEIERELNSAGTPLPQRYGVVEAVSLGRALKANWVMGGIVSELGYLREQRGINEKSVFSGTLWVVDPRLGKRVAYYSFSSREGSDYFPQKPTFTEQILRTLAPYLSQLKAPQPGGSS